MVQACACRTREVADQTGEDACALRRRLRVIRPRADRQLGVGEDPEERHCELERDELVAVADEHEGRRLDRLEPFWSQSLVFEPHRCGLAHERPPLLGPAGMRGLDLLRELAELRVELLQIRNPSIVGPEELPMSVPKPAAGEVGIGSTHDQCSRRTGMACSELEGNLASVAPAAHHRTSESQRVDQPGRVVGDLGVGEPPIRVVRAAMPSTVWRDHSEVIDELREERLPLRARPEPAVYEHEWSTLPALFDVERGTVHLDRAAGHLVVHCALRPREQHPCSPMALTQCGVAARDRRFRIEGVQLLGLGTRAHPSEQHAGKNGRADDHGGADGGGQLQPVGERLAGRVEQLGAERVGELFAGGHRAAERVACGLRRLGRDAGRDCAFHLAAVDRGADAAEDRDAERTAELGAGLRDRRRRRRPARAGRSRRSGRWPG